MHLRQAITRRRLGQGVAALALAPLLPARAARMTRSAIATIALVVLSMLSSRQLIAGLAASAVK